MDRAKSGPDSTNHSVRFRDAHGSNPSSAAILVMALVGAIGCPEQERRRPPPTDPMAVSSSAATTAATPAATRSNQESAKEEALATQEGAAGFAGQLLLEKRVQRPMGVSLHSYEWISVRVS